MGTSTEIKRKRKREIVGEDNKYLPDAMDYDELKKVRRGKNKPLSDF